jgi:hypothetical protein
MDVGSEQAKTPPESQVSPRAKWKYQDKATEFHIGHRYARYAIDFLATLEAEMYDPELSKEHRVLAGIKRFAWGHLSDVAVNCMPKLGPEDPEPRPLTQADFARRIKMSPASVSEACTFLRDRGHLRCGVKELYPEDHPIGELSRSASKLSQSQSVNLTAEPNSDSSNGDSPFVLFRREYLDVHTDVAKEIDYHKAERDRHYAAARKERDELDRIKHQILGAFRNEGRKSAKTAKQPSAADSDPTRAKTAAAAASATVPDSPLRTPPPDPPSPVSDSTNQSFVTPEQNFRTPQAPIQTPPALDPPKPNAINAGSGPPLKALTNDSKYESPSSSSSALLGTTTTTVGSSSIADGPDLTPIDTAARKICHPDEQFLRKLFRSLPGPSARLNRRGSCGRC